MAFIPFLANAQTPEDSLKQVINQFFVGMKTSDTTLIKSTLAPSVVFQTIAEVSVRNESIHSFLTSVSKAQKGWLDERISFGSIQSDGLLASIWTPYSFYYQGKRSHCGTNSFQLARLNGVWKIQYIIDTRKKTNCEGK